MEYVNKSNESPVSCLQDCSLAVEVATLETAVIHILVVLTMVPEPLEVRATVINLVAPVEDQEVVSINFNPMNTCLLIEFCTDSTSGKLMEKVGGMFHHKGMEEKGAEKRSQSGYGDDSTSGGYGGNDQSNY